MEQFGWNNFSASLENDLDAELDNPRARSSVGDNENAPDDDDLWQSAPTTDKVQQKYDYICILDFEACRQWAGSDPDDDEWIIEITEFPVLLLDLKTLKVEHEFHKYCMPTLIEGSVVDSYVQSKYGDRFGRSEEWKATAKPLPTILAELHQWLIEKQLLSESGEPQKSFMFLTCGDWDLHNALPRNMDRLGLAVPPYLQEWINIKRAFGAFYKSRRDPAGMTEMLKELGLKLEGHHHLGLHDCRNICRIAVVMLEDGWVAEATGNIKNQTAEERKGKADQQKKKRRDQGKGYLAKRRRNGVCSYWLRGACTRGDGCRFAHEKIAS